MEQKNASSNKRVAVTITGKVQGVGYRYFIKEAAQRYHICGWVKNLANGAVFLEAQGEESLLKRFVQDVGVGPRASHVEEMKVEDIKAKDQDRSFSIRISEASGKSPN